MALLPLSKNAPLAESVREIGQNGDFAHSFCFKLTVNVHESDELEFAMKNGAPNTSQAVWERVARMHEEFPPDFSRRTQREVLFVSFGAFVKQSLFESFAAKARARHKLNYMGIRTMLAVGGDYWDLCRERGVRRMRLVSLARKVRHLNLWHVPTLHL
jgi:hypothetical protein